METLRTKNIHVKDWRIIIPYHVAKNSNKEEKLKKSLAIDIFFLVLKMKKVEKCKINRM